MMPDLLPCRCGKTPTLRTIDVTSLSVAHYLHCSCGANTSWHFKADACVTEWNKANPAQFVEPVQTKPVYKPAQPTHAAMVLARKKGELAYAG
jgi:hypothetical protein